MVKDEVFGGPKPFAQKAQNCGCPKTRGTLLGIPSKGLPYFGVHIRATPF